VRQPEWFRRFGDISGVRFEGAPGIRRESLSGHDATPEFHSFEMDGTRRNSLWWRENGGGGSASPAHHRAFGDVRTVGTADIVRNVYEGLELPGEPSDYHFLIQAAANELWGRRREDPGVLEEVERLCWLDIQLVEARPDAASDEFSDEPRFHAILTFGILINLYEREGFLPEALDVAQRAARCGQGDAAEQELMRRVQAVEAEDAN
jgi:hypothetical protein